MNGASREAIPHLVALGFTEIEAAAYAFLVERSPATGYRVAQGIGKPVANTYKAIQSLRHKGAVIVDETARRHCRAVPPTELLGHLEERRQRRVQDATQALARLQPAGGDEGLYTLTSRQQILERCRDMLARATEVALLDAFPEPLAQVRAAVVDAAARGLQVAVEVYEPIELERVEVISNPRGRAIQKRWPGSWLNLVIDGSEHLLAFFTSDGQVSQAVWSRSPYLAWIYHCGVSAEMTAARLIAAVHEGATPAALKRLARDLERVQAWEAPGYRSLRRRLAQGRVRSPRKTRGST